MSFSRRRGTDNNRTHTQGISDITWINNDYHRLRLLENAVVNYSGGRDKLESRVREEAQRMLHVDPDVATLLRDVAVYLHDVAVAGELVNERDTEDWL